jgi:hypothetical protein
LLLQPLNVVVLIASSQQEHQIVAGLSHADHVFETELGDRFGHRSTVPFGADTRADRRLAISASRSAAACW